eukprot:TRINITY_DN12_c0_g1_i3.p1 TRINITY_DN12_c0_g1~~TRINITY_DN12_c0_g1_i3.p1  ORF type:complete len:2440 (-),score=653.16 TRINITY_DN12_c0_g1_i3:246-7565(-)
MASAHRIVLFLAFFLLSLSLSVLCAPAGTSDSLNKRPFIYGELSNDVTDQSTDDQRRGAVVGEPSFIPLGIKQKNEGNLFEAYSFIFKSLSKNNAKFIEYPYAFNRTVNGKTVPYNEGALIASDDISADYTSKFAFLNDNTTIDLTRAKAVYDSGIAILSVSGVYGGSTRDLTYDSSRYCSALHDYILGKWGDCYTGKEYLSLLKDNPTFESTSIVYVSPEDITGGILTTSRFGTLIIGDIYEGSEDTIVAALGSVGKTQISNFNWAGGLVYASAKGALVAKLLGLTGVQFSETSLLGVKGTRAYVSGCDSKSSTLDEYEWIKGSLCFSSPKDSETSTTSIASLSSTPIVTSASSFKVLATFSSGVNASYQTIDINTGATTPISNIESKNIPYLLASQRGAGYVVLTMGSPASYSQTYPWLYNALFLANSRPLIVDTQVTGKYKYFPASEQISLQINAVFQNLYNRELNATTLLMWVAKGTTIMTTPSACTLINQTLTTPKKTAPNSLLDPNIYLDCSPTSTILPAFGIVNITFTLFIQDVSITQNQFDILMAQPQIAYTDLNRGNMKTNLVCGAVTINAYLAATIRTDMNADPMGLYPIPGTGAYIDDVLQAENKENTQALNVKYVSIVPLVSPVVDGVNQRLVSHALTFDYMYYQKQYNYHADYVYPFTKTTPVRDEDYLDFRVLGYRGNYMVADWDSPVKNFKIARNSAFPSNLPQVNVSDVGNSGLTTTVDSGDKLIQERNMQDGDTFYEIGTPRLLAFLDVTDPKAFDSYNKASSFKTGSVESWKLAGDKKRMKSDLVLAHVDYYFYNVTQQYPLPEGVTSANTIFTVDTFNNKATDYPSCFQKYGQQSSKILYQGYYGNDKVNGYYPPGLAPSEYGNALFTLCNRNIISYDDAETKTGGKVTKTHYIIPLTDNTEITSLDDIMHFKVDSTDPDDYYYDPSEQQARYGTYKSVRATWVYHGTVDISPEETRKGGKMVVTLSGGINFKSTNYISKERVSIQPDQVASMGTKYISQNSFEYYFKRGNMPNEGWGKSSHMGINLERVASTADSINVTVQVYDMSYDLSASAPYETYTAGKTYTVTLKRIVALSLPALKMEFTLNRGDSGTESFMQPYESLEPFVRVGTYTQELKQHATIWADPEVHFNYPEKGQGIVGKGSDLLWLTNLGINPIPFAEYLQTGATQMIPSSTMNSHVEWNDIWGRLFAQPVRSIYPDNAPIPAPVRNFQMSTTFQILSPTSKTREMVWQSDEKKVVHVQAKMTNNYERWFDLTVCKANELLVEKGYIGTVFDDTYKNTKATDYNHFLTSAHKSSYGACLASGKLVLEGKTITDPTMRNNMANAALCVTSEGDWYENCPWAKAVNQSKYPILTKLDSTSVSGSQWQYIEQLKNHYPSGYITEPMWDMTERDYEDTMFNKGSPWHLDNNVPGLDGLTRPHNIIAFPLYKGVNYNMEYSTASGLVSHSRFNGKKGWWSDNLQNRDITLLAGNSKVNAVSVGQDPLVTDWISADDLLTNGTNSIKGQLKSRYNNMYVCEFNRKRPRVYPGNGVMTYPSNVYVNNVVPIDVTLEKNDDRLFNYACDTSKPMYTPDTISQFSGNYLKTETTNDWLYFGSNLRAGALENINVLYNLNPSTVLESRQEGMTKVHEGGRFVYWNPTFGPNTFQVVDDLANIVMARRTDVTVTHDKIPSESSTFKSTVIHHINMADKAEINRQWDSTIYYNYNGFGDASTSVYVGGYKGSSALVEPGETTYVEVVFYNNAGFDWNLKANAINATEIASMPISANDLLYNLKHSIQVPNQYRFMELTFKEPELKQYITIAPSGHNVDTAPLFFDFENINVATIRDGFKGRYFYKLDVSPNLPQKYKGKLHEISIGLKTEYFDVLPGPNDPTPKAFKDAGHHDYTLTVPSIVFGVPYESTHSLAGGVYWTSGHAFNLKLTHKVEKTHTPVQACIINKETLTNLSIITGDPTTMISKLQTFWAKLNTTCTVVPFTTTPDGDYNTVTFDFSNLGSQFPFPNGHEPEIADLDILLQTYAAQVPAGRKVVSTLTQVGYNDDASKSKSDATVPQLSVNFVGPYLELDIDSTLYNNDMQMIGKGVEIAEDMSGYVSMNITATNIGNGDAFYTDLIFYVPSSFEVQHIDTYSFVKGADVGGYSPITVNTEMNMSPGVPLFVSALFRFTSASSGQTSGNNRVFLQRSAGKFDLTSAKNLMTVTQTLDEQVTWPLIQTSASKKSSSVWVLAIILPTIALLALFLAAALIKRKRQGGLEPDTEFNNPISEPAKEEPVAAKSAPAVAPRVPARPERKQPAQPAAADDDKPIRHRLADANYLMTGGKGLKIKNGNPTAPAEPDDEGEDVKEYGAKNKEENASAKKNAQKTAHTTTQGKNAQDEGVFGKVFTFMAFCGEKIILFFGTLWGLTRSLGSKIARFFRRLTRKLCH